MEVETESKIVLRLNKNLWNKNLTIVPEDDIEPDDFSRKRSLSTCSSSSNKRLLSPKAFFPKMTIEELSNQSASIIQQLNLYLNEFSNNILRSLPSHVDSRIISPILNIRYKDIINHCLSLRLESLQRFIFPLIQKLMQHPKNSNLFNHPVDPVALDIPDYLVTIKKPMDLGTIKSRLQRGQFESLTDIINLINLVFDNAMTFNNKNHFIHETAYFLKNEFSADLDSTIDKYSKEEEKKSSHFCSTCCGSTCVLCGEKCLKLELPVLVCCGPCGLKIKRSNSYHITSDGTKHWCQKCFSSLPQVIETKSDMTIFKRDILKRKSEEDIVEPWVECSTCHNRVHEICTLFNSKFLSDKALNDDSCQMELERSTTSSSSSYLNNCFQCPTCLLNSVKLSPKAIVRNDSDLTSELCSNSLEHVLTSSSKNNNCNASDGAVTDTEQDHDLDNNCSGDISSDCHDDAYTNSSTNEEPEDDIGSEVSGFSSSERPHNLKKNNKSDLNDKIKNEYKKSNNSFSARSLPRSRLSDFLEAMVVDRLHSTGYGSVAKTISIRMVSNVDQYQEVPSVILENMMTPSGKKISQHIPYRQKCILLFQEIDGIDVCLFCLYVHEFNADCPEPNKSSIYIAYLDSVEYFRPMEARTMVYHEIMIGYLQWSQFRGFEKCYIWSCPPQRGDNFIFWCHPNHQRTPSRERLGSWYTTMLERGTHLGIIEKISNLYNTHFADYHKRDKDNTIHRQASINSFVNSMLLAKQPDNSLHSSGANSKSEFKQASAPIAPPIFEGDFWVNECLKVYRNVLARAKGGDGNDKMANHRDARELIKTLMSRPLAVPFNQPVDPVALNIPTYFSVIKEPMDLKTIQEKVRGNAVYSNLFQFVQDVRLTFKNAMTFNPQGHFVYNSAEILLNEFNQSLFELMNSRLGIMADLDHLDNWLTSLILRDEISFKPFGRAKSLDFNLSLSLDENSKPSDIVLNEDSCHSYTNNDKVNNSSSLEPPRLIRSYSDGLCSPELLRCDTSESFMSVATNDMYEQNIRRNYSSRAYIGPPPEALYPIDEPFVKPQLGFRGASSLMLELSKCVQRLKDDLFVATFAKPEYVINKSKLRQAGISLSEEKRSSPIPNMPPPIKQTRGKGRPPLNKKMDVKFASDVISDYCISILLDLPRDMSDPDDQILSPIADARNTFLEICQYRYYQFDTLRRAKYSSLSLIYHLHHPYAKHLRPICSLCSNVIVSIRWHCDTCMDYDICSDCNCSAVNQHSHDLTPMRVSFI